MGVRYCFVTASCMKAAIDAFGSKMRCLSANATAKQCTCSPLGLKRRFEAPLRKVRLTALSSDSSTRAMREPLAVQCSPSATRIKQSTATLKQSVSSPASSSSQQPLSGDSYKPGASISTPTESIYLSSRFLQLPFILLLTATACPSSLLATTT